MTASLAVFLILAAVSVISALVVILHPHPVYSALSLVVTLFQIAALFILLDAEMIAFLQVLVYAGAIMVLFLFVIMLLNLQRSNEGVPPGWRAIVLVTGVILAGELGWYFLRIPMPAGGGAVDASYGSVAALGRKLFVDHLLSFEITSILLLVAIVGAVVIARRGPE